MKSKQLIILPLIIIMALGAGYWIGNRSDLINDSKTKIRSVSNHSSSKKQRKILYWKAPMNPNEIYHHPGKSKMGMDLVPVYEDENKADTKGKVRIDPVTEQDMGVRTDFVRKGKFSKTIRTVGTIGYDKNRLYSVNLKYSGWVEKLYANYEGQMIHKGEALLTIYSPDLVTTQQEYLLALQTRNTLNSSTFKTIQKDGESLLEAARKRLDYWDLSQSFIDKLKSTGRVEKTIVLRSPVSGVIINRNVEEGTHIKAGTNILQIADLSKIWVNASIYDYELPWIKKGQPVTMSLSYLPGEQFTGYIDYIYPTLDEKARDVNVRIVFPNTNLELKPGMYANIDIKGKTISDALFIPDEAVIHSGTRNIVFVAGNSGTFEPRNVKLGVEGGDNNQYIQVLSGLNQGEKIVTSSQFLLDSESRLQEAIQKMLENKPKQMKMGKMDMKKGSVPSTHQMSGRDQKRKSSASRSAQKNNQAQS